MVHSLITNLPASATRMEEIRHATETDPCLQMLAKTVKTGWPHHRRSIPPEIRQYWGVRNEVMAADGLLFLGDRLIIPSSLRSDMLQRIHEGHLGIEKCKARARAVMYWPGISESIETTNQGQICWCYIVLILLVQQQLQYNTQREHLIIIS